MTEQPTLIPMTPGERLRDGRLRKNLSTEEASQRLKCNESVVIDLEADRVPSLAPVYLKGYISAYARLLGIPESELQFETTSAGVDNTTVQSVFPEAARIPRTEKWLRASSYVLASLLVGTLAWQVSHEAVRIANVNESADATDPGSPAPVKNRETGTHMNASIASLESLGSNSEGRTGSAGQRAWEALDKSNHLEALADGEFRLDLKTSADSWVEILDATGAQLEQDLVRAGSARQYSGTPPFRITFGRSSAVELFVNGEPVELLPHTTDDVVQMRLDPRLTAEASTEPNQP